MVFNSKMVPKESLIFHEKVSAMLWVRVIYNALLVSESCWWFCPLKCRSTSKEKKDVEFCWRPPSKGCLKFNVCGVKSEDAMGSGGVLRDDEE